MILVSVVENPHVVKGGAVKKYIFEDHERRE
jgi:hypothetical protein